MDQTNLNIATSRTVTTGSGYPSDAMPDGDRSASRTASFGKMRTAGYLLGAFALTACGLAAIADANRRYAPEMYQSDYMATVAEAFAGGNSFAVFDLNLNIRKLREEQFKRLAEKPPLIVLGASQWQEASADLIAKRGYMNAHVHRDYYEDVLGMVDLLVQHDRLPTDLVITIRDKIFTPVENRTDYLWLPGIPYYQDMAKRLSLEPLTFWETQPLQRPRELISMGMLYTNATRWHNAPDWPYPTKEKRLETLDILHPDGSITWSKNHLALFTQDRSRKLARAYADMSRNNPPRIDPKGVDAFDRLLAYLSVRGVRVHLAHPPFNPIFFDNVQNSPYLSGLRQVEAVARELAERHKLNIVGNFDPAALGCTAENFIDAEHSNADCLRKLLAEVANSIDLPKIPHAQPDEEKIAGLEYRSLRKIQASGWMGLERATAASVAHAPSGFTDVNRDDAATAAVPHRHATTGDASEPTHSRLRTTPPLAPRETKKPPSVKNQANARRTTPPSSALKRNTAIRRDRKLQRNRSASTASPVGLTWPGDNPRQYR